MSAPVHTDALLELIEQRAGAVTVDLLAVLDRVRRRLAQLFINPDKIYPGELAGIVDQVLQEMAVAARRAVRAGSDRDAVGDALDAQQRRLGIFARALRETDRPSLARALAMLRPADVLVSTLKGFISDQEVSKSTQAARDALRAGNRDVLMWVPERDACVRCLRYAGLRLLSPRDEFPAGLSYDPKQADSAAGKVPGPPLHPHCRCELQRVPRGQSEDASEALRREADRSILKGWARESEANAARERAAKALLASGVVAPKSVKAEAARRLRAGGPFIREVPGGP